MKRLAHRALPLWRRKDRFGPEGSNVDIDTFLATF